MTGPLRAAIVMAYGLVFCLLLPASLVVLSGRLDERLAWQAAPSGWGLVFVGAGIALLAAAMLALARGGGLPVGALPPPTFVHGGAYAWTRHPIYAGFNLVLFGVGLAQGSPALAWIVAPLFAPLWIAYALFEERGLLRRFGTRYARYRRRVGVLPCPPAYGVSHRLVRLFPVRVEGGQHVPRRGGAVLVANHCCLLDPAFVALATAREIRFVATAEAFRAGLLRWYVLRAGVVPLRRYRPDVVAGREVVRLLDEGELVGIFAEGERSVHGDYRGSLPKVARWLSKLDHPVIPAGLSGSFDCGPRWNEGLRRRPVVLRVGAPLVFGSGDAARTVDAAIRALLDHDPQPLHLEGLRAERFVRALWRCPRCLDEARWRPALLSCDACGVRYAPAAEGGLEDPDGRRSSLAELGGRLRAAPEPDPLVVRAAGAEERDLRSPIRPLAPLGETRLEIGSHGIRFGALALPLREIASVTTERADTLQVASAEIMWQFRPRGGSVFRLHWALDRWRAAELGATRAAAES